MSVFGGNQVGEIIVGKTYGGQSDIVDFIENGTDGDVQIFSGDGSALTEGLFKVIQKANGAAGGIEYTEVIDPKTITSLKVAQYKAPVKRELKVTGFTGTPRANVTYEVFIRLLNDGGTLSPENFRMIPAFYVTPDDVTGLTFETILNSIKSDLEKSLSREGNSGLFTVAVDVAAGELSITGNNTPFVLSKKDGRAVEYNLQAAVRGNGSLTEQSGSYYADLTVETVTAGNKGTGVGTEVANLEWFLKGNKYDRYRLMGYPANFDTEYLINPNSTYNVINISYYKERNMTNVEKQHRYAYIVFENADQDGEGAETSLTAINAFIDALEVATGTTIDALV